MKVDLKVKLPPRTALKDLPPGQPFAYAPPAESWLESKPYLAGPWVGLDFPNERWVTNLETGEPLRWRDSVSVRVIENAKLIGELSGG